MPGDTTFRAERFAQAIWLLVLRSRRADKHARLCVEVALQDAIDAAIRAAVEIGRVYERGAADGLRAPSVPEILRRAERAGMAVYRDRLATFESERLRMRRTRAG